MRPDLRARVRGLAAVYEHARRGGGANLSDGYRRCLADVVADLTDLLEDDAQDSRAYAGVHRTAAGERNGR